jgi:hypothetical protein
VATLIILAAKITKPEYWSLISFFVKDLHQILSLDFRTLNAFKILVVDYVVRGTGLEERGV